MTQPLPKLPLTLIQAIAREEGFYDPNRPNDRPQRDNNPGDLEWHDWMARFGATKGDPRFAIFPSPATGFAALRHLLGFPGYKGKTITAAITEFAPGNENDTAAYIRNVCAWCESSPDTIIDGIIG